MITNMPGGRPSEYTPDIVEKARSYVDNCPDLLPSIEGLALFINKARDTVYRWSTEEGKEEFSDIFSKLKLLQAKTLIENGLTSEWNSTIVKVILTKHGYNDKVETELYGKDGKEIKTQSKITFVPAKMDETD